MQVLHIVAPGEVPQLVGIALEHGVGLPAPDPFVRSDVRTSQVVPEAGVEYAVLHDIQRAVRAGVEGQSHLVIDVAPGPELVANLHNRVFIGIGAAAEVEDVVLHHAAPLVLADELHAGPIRVQRTVDVAHLRDDVSTLHGHNRSHEAVTAAKAHIGRLMDAVAYEHALIHAYLLFIDGIDDGDAPVGAYLGYIFRAYL